jgi:hypothetical protein
MTTSASCLSQKTVLLKYMDLKMIQKNFQSSMKQISTTLSPTDWRCLYSSLRAKLVRVFMNKNFC